MPKLFCLVQDGLSVSVSMYSHIASLVVASVCCVALSLCFAVLSPQSRFRSSLSSVEYLSHTACVGVHL